MIKKIVLSVTLFIARVVFGLVFSTPKEKIVYKEKVGVSEETINKIKKII